MSKKEKDTNILMSKKSTSQKLKDLSKYEGQHINVSEGVSELTLSNALKVKSQLEEIEAQQKELEKRYQALRDQIVDELSDIQASQYDTVEYVNNGKRAHLYPKNTQSGKIDEVKLEKLARKKKIYSKIFKPTVVVDDKELIKALQDGTISTDEFRAITLQKITHVLEIKLVSETKVQEVEDLSVV
jgi:predicted transcriptional regulator